MAGPGGEATGTIFAIGDVKQVTDTFRKRSLVLMFGSGKYIDHVEFELTGDRVDILDDYAEGEVVKVAYNLRGRQRRNGDGCFNSLAVWKIAPATIDADPPRERPERQRGPRNDPPPTRDDQPRRDPDDLPF